jgi:hypothetical protein
LLPSLLRFHVSRRWQQSVVRLWNFLVSLKFRFNSAADNSEIRPSLHFCRCNNTLLGPGVA